MARKAKAAIELIATGEAKIINNSRRRTGRIAPTKPVELTDIADITVGALHAITDAAKDFIENGVWLDDNEARANKLILALHQGGIITNTTPARDRAANAKRVSQAIREREARDIVPPTIGRQAYDWLKKSFSY